MKHPDTAQRGFTLIEIVVVMTIMIILASIALPSMQQHITKGQLHATQANMRIIDSMLAEHYLNSGHYPQRIIDAINANRELTFIPTPQHPTYHISVVQTAAGQGYSITALAQKTTAPCQKLQFFSSGMSKHTGSQCQ